MAIESKVLTIPEVAVFLKCHTSSIHRMLKKGQIPGFKIGTDWRFNIEEIVEWTKTGPFSVPGN